MDEIRIILHGIRIRHELQIADGITLIPFPNSSEDPIPISPGLPTIITEEPTSYLGKVLLRIDYCCSQKNVKSKEFPDFKSQYLAFLDHLSVICGNRVHRIKAWVQPEASNSAGISVVSSLQEPYWRPVDISESEISKTKEQFNKFTKLKSGVRKKLDIAISRWVKSKTETNIINRIIDLAIAFEVLYSNESREQLSLTFRLRAAWHLGSDLQERQGLLSFFKNIYDARSEAVHSGKFSKKSSAKVNKEKLAEADKWFAQAIKKFIDEGNFPDWDSLVVGGTRKRGSKDK